MKKKIIKAILRWIWIHYKSEFIALIVAERQHLHKNPVKKPQAYPVTGE